MRRQAHTVDTLSPSLAKEGKAMSIEPGVDSKDAAYPPPVWERLVPVRPQCHWSLPLAIGAAGLVASGTLIELLWSTIGRR